MARIPLWPFWFNLFELEIVLGVAWPPQIELPVQARRRVECKQSAKNMSTQTARSRSRSPCRLCIHCGAVRTKRYEVRHQNGTDQWQWSCHPCMWGKNSPRSDEELSNDADGAPCDDDECGSTELRPFSAHLSGEMRGEKGAAVDDGKGCSSKGQRIPLLYTCIPKSIATDIDKNWQGLRPLESSAPHQYKYFPAQSDPVQAVIAFEPEPVLRASHRVFMFQGIYGDDCPKWMEIRALACGGYHVVQCGSGLRNSFDLTR